LTTTINSSLLNKSIGILKKVVDELAAAMDAKPSAPQPEEDEPAPVRTNPYSAGSQDWFMHIQRNPPKPERGITSSELARRAADTRRPRWPKTPAQARGEEAATGPYMR
jgi:hypothetical protein